MNNDPTKSSSANAFGCRSFSNDMSDLQKIGNMSATNGFKPYRNIVPIQDKIVLVSRERRWVSNFQMMFSKDNHKYPKMMRELFENPIQYDVNGAKIQVPHPYGWDILEDSKTVLPSSPKGKSPKISSINTIAFSNYITSTQNLRKSYKLLAPLSPQIGTRKSIKFAVDHLMVRRLLV